MVTVLTLRPDIAQATVTQWPWGIHDGPVHLSVARALAQAGSRDWLIIAKGPLSGRDVVASAVATITCPSAQGHGLAEAQVEGPLAHGLTTLGVDAIVISGRAAEATGITCEGFGETLTTSFDAAGAVASLEVGQKDNTLRTSQSDIVITTGTVGMAEHPAASVVINRGFPTTQGGCGAVLGRLRLSHLVFRGHGSIPPATELEHRVTASYDAAIAGNPLTASEKNYPGFAMWVAQDLVGYQASPEFSGQKSTGAAAFSAEAMMAFAKDDGAHACPGCPQGCLKSFTNDAKTPTDAGRSHQLGVSGAALLADISDADVLVAFNQMCHDLGVEHLSAADALRGTTVTSESLEADIRGALERYPLGPEPSLRVKGMVVPPFDPRGNQGLGVGFALNPTGPRYDVLEHDIDFEAGQHWMGRENLQEDFGVPPTGIPMGTLGPERHTAIIRLWLAWSGLDALGLCEFAAPPTRELTIEQICELAGEIGGAPFTKDDFVQVGQLRLALLRDTHRLLGGSVHDDTLPEVFFDTPVIDGRLAGAVIDRDEFEAACGVVRRELGWDDDGGIADADLRDRVEDVTSAVWKRMESVAT